MQLTVPGVHADAGIALDGDGDRLVMVDHLGRIVDGDQLLYVIARHMHERGLLRGPVVGTVMSNLGLEVAFRELGIPFARAAVGDRYVLQMLKERGGVLGGETSGHLLQLDKTTTGDGLVAALAVLAIMRDSGKSLAELTASLARYPQKMINVRIEHRFDIDGNAALSAAVRAAEAAMAGRGRIVLRASGTEPVVRVMVEGEDEHAILAHAEALAEVVREQAARAR